MIEKSKRKKKINDEHSKNYDAGAVDVDERQLRRTGVRGRKIYVLIFVLMLLFLLFLANLIILIVIYNTDNINYQGMESISFYKDGKTKFHQNSDMTYIYPLDSILGGYENENILIDGSNQKIFIRGGPSTLEYPSVSVGPDGTDIKIKKSFTFTDPTAAEKVLYLDHHSVLKKEGRFVGDTLKANSIRTPRIISDDTHDLNLNGSIINITGSEGVYMDSKSFILETGGNIGITINDAKGSLKLGPKIQMDRSTLTDTASKRHKVLDAHRYRLCACASTGKLFKVRILDGRATSCASASKNPCV